MLHNINIKALGFVVSEKIFSCLPYTVELWWLELVGTVGASSTHPCVRATPCLTIFKLVHVNFMSSRTPRFFRPKLQSACDTRHWSITLCTLELKWLAACVFKVTTLSACAYAQADQCICYRVSCTTCLLVVFMCRYSLCSVVYRFL